MNAAKVAFASSAFWLLSSWSLTYVVVDVWPTCWPEVIAVFVGLSQGPILGLLYMEVGSARSHTVATRAGARRCGQCAPPSIDYSRSG